MPVLPFTLVAAMALPLAAGAADPNPLQAERWKTRPVVVVVPEDDDPLLRKVRAALDRAAGREAFRKREMALYTVVGGRGRRNGRPLAARQTAAMLRALGLDARGPAAFVLVGKDGGVKMREGADVELQAVFDEIDRMPMRQRR
ncbi:MAG: hypothetical protein DI563_24540 [Variovorax paradoxus]|uniref:DUF4174 domain-containing protein n=1 Tax=Variovorax paradoxus TaxID=34073 RepID=A0A2W5R6S5_VARPD|nr:MAG: hypothetical protein DI563_24540 [Variovorax paradoxus]